MKISILHASLGRPYRALDTAKLWLKQAKTEIEYIFSTESDDVLTQKVFAESLPAKRIFSEYNAIKADGSTRCNVGAMNLAAAIATGDILVQVHDDTAIQCDGWDEKIIELFKNNPGKHVLRLQDGVVQHRDDGLKLMTHKICTREYYKSKGYFYYPEYKAIYADDDATLEAEFDGVLFDADEPKLIHMWCGPIADTVAAHEHEYGETDYAFKILTERKKLWSPSSTE